MHGLDFTLFYANRLAGELWGSLESIEQLSPEILFVVDFSEIDSFRVLENGIGTVRYDFAPEAGG